MTIYCLSTEVACVLVEESLEVDPTPSSCNVLHVDVVTADILREELEEAVEADMQPSPWNVLLAGVLTADTSTKARDFLKK